MTPNSLNRTPVVILNMHYTGLAIARDLWRPERTIIGLSSDTRFFGNRSRYITFRRCPDTETEPESCKQFLLDLSRTLPGPALLLPTRDHDIHFILRYRDELAGGFLIPYPDSSIVETIMDKAALARVAESVSVYCPRSVEIHNRDDLSASRSALAFPAIVKPVVAAHWRKAEVRDVIDRKKALKINKFEELERLYVTLELLAPDVIVQEYIDGPESNLVVFGSYSNRDSEVVASFTGRKLIQYPSGAGTGVAVRASIIQEIVEPSRKLLKQLAYTGMSEIEYKLDEVSGRYGLIEINPRHWDQHGLGDAVGVNLSEIMYADLCEGHHLSSEQRPGNICWVAEDGLLLSLRSNFKHRAYRWSVYLDIMSKPKTLAVMRWRDPKPVLSLLVYGIADAAVGLLRFLARLVGVRKRTGP